MMIPNPVIYMKMKSKIILAIVVLTFVSVSAFAHVSRQRRPQCSPHTYGAPLDGGLLSVLGAAGVAYFVARRKKKKLDQ